MAENEILNLDPHQARQAETQKQAADGAVSAGFPRLTSGSWCPNNPIRMRRSRGKPRGSVAAMR